MLVIPTSIFRGSAGEDFDSFVNSFPNSLLRVVFIIFSFIDCTLIGVNTVNPSLGSLE